MSKSNMNDKEAVYDILNTLRKETDSKSLSRSQRIMKRAADIIDLLIKKLDDNNISLEEE